MIAKPVCALALACLAAPADPRTAPQFTVHPAVEQVLCEEGKGSAFRISRTTLLSVFHVTGMTGCKVDGEPISITYHSRAQDFALIEANPSPSWIKLDCGGFQRSEWYYALGYARGEARIQVLPLKATGVDVALKYGGRFEILTGQRVIPGMSGGPILNSRNEAVGLVNAYSPWAPQSFSRELKGTAACE